MIVGAGMIRLVVVYQAFDGPGLAPASGVQVAGSVDR